MHTVEIESISRQLPSCWDEMTKQQLRLLYQVLRQETPIQRVKITMLMQAMKLKMDSRRRSWLKVFVGYWKRVYMTPEHYTTLSTCYDFLFTEPDQDGGCLLEVDLTRNPYPSIRAGKGFREVILEGSEKGLSDITYHQYQFLCHYMSMLKESPLEAMRGMFGVLYRPIGEGFDAARIEEISAMAPDDEFLLTALLWYVTGSMRQITDRFPKVFGGGGGDDSDGAFMVQMKVLDALTDGDVSRRDSVRCCALFDVLHNLQLKIETAEKRKRNGNI